MTDYKQLCAELTDALDNLSCNYNVPNQSALVERALAALAEPEPEGPTNEELEDLFNRHCFHDEGLGIVEFQNAARAVLARWSSDGPAVQSMEPASVVTEPSDKDLHSLWLELYAFQEGVTSGDVTEIARAVLARWGSS